MMTGLALTVMMATGSGCTDAGDHEALGSSTHAALWSPRPIDPALCNNEEPPPSRPPDPATMACDIEVRIKSATFETGQGATEGRGEIRGIFTAEPVAAPPGSALTTAVMPEQDFNVGQDVGLDLALGEYRVPAGTTLDVRVCASFVENDYGGFNGEDDFSKPCTIVRLACGPVVGQRTTPRALGPALFCQDDGAYCNGSMSAAIELIRKDADGDNIPNETDVTPDVCDEELKGTNGIGLVLYFHYDDGGPATLGQSLWTNLTSIYGAYDYVVLVADNHTSNPNNTSQAAWTDADRVFPPTRDGLRDAIQHMTAEGYRFDVFIHSHGYPDGTDDSEFEVLSGDRVTGQWLVDTTAPEVAGTARGGIPIVAVWGTNCYAVDQNDAWDEVGAIAGSGGFKVQFYPNAWGNFGDAWIAGQDYQTAVDDSVTATVIQDAEDLIYAMGSVAPWWCAYGLSVLGRGLCAEDFFTDTDRDTDGPHGPDKDTDDAAYDIVEIYDNTLSGAQNMSISSARTFVGDTTVTFGGPGHTWN